MSVKNLHCWTQSKTCFNSMRQMFATRGDHMLLSLPEPNLRNKLNSSTLSRRLIKIQKIKYILPPKHRNTLKMAKWIFPLNHQNTLELAKCKLLLPKHWNTLRLARSKLQSAKKHRLQLPAKQNYVKMRVETRCSPTPKVSPLCSRSKRGQSLVKNFWIWWKKSVAN